ncbi:hypothetical protein BJ875DRAFT_200917 [Amylocarpus encephaloides]|uniref:Uncharacterized protein n=1 Tax=Amylocarpus encephaloides TaxID=45428 RepID=A0A9P7Y9I4_9HELO|nr:hypothetical protein BJ875DRAFT_200917 [Amylocarpus encephaloides]
MRYGIGTSKKCDGITQLVVVEERFRLRRQEPIYDPEIDESFYSTAKMGSRIASSCPPMTLREREALDVIQIGFVIPPLPKFFLVSATEVLTKALLKDFINRLLSTIHPGDLIEIPKTDCWGLKGNGDAFIDLNAWNPRQTRQDVYKVIALPSSSDPNILNPISTQWALLAEGGSWPPRVKSIQLPSREVFEVRGPHLLVVIH